MKPGDLVKYMSRIVLIIDIDEVWAHGIELGETHVAKYKLHCLKDLPKSAHKVAI
jgi:hypothetical protein